MDWTPQEDVMKKVLEVLEDSFIPDSTVQRNVQETLRELQQNPEFCSYLLLVCESNQSFDDKMRALAGLILKNNIVYLYATIPAHVKLQMQHKCLAMLNDSSKEVRLSASVLINVMVQQEGFESMSNIITVILNLITMANDEVAEAGMKTLVLITEDYMNGLSYGAVVDETIKALLNNFVDLTGHRSLEVRKWAFRILNETLQKHYYYVMGDFDRRAYLEKLISHAIDEHPQIIIAVVHGFVVFVNNQDDTILPAMNDVICYMITKSVDDNADVALQAGDFWLALSKLQLCVTMLRGHLKTLIPILLKNMRKCPKSLLSQLIKIVIDEVRTNCKKDPIAYGFNISENAYEPLKLMQSVILAVNEICLRYLDNSVLCTLPSPGPPPSLVSIHAVRNARRRMEDRHVVVHDLNTIFNKNVVSPSSYYAIFDGHGGQDAASYGAAHLHQYLAESQHFACQPNLALTEAFCRTDILFIEKCKVENFSGGSTAVCALLRPKEKSLFLAWVGDSQAVLAKQGLVRQCVNPHKPDRPDERERIKRMGGTVLYWGTWRVNGQLAVSRAIGDAEYKPYITAEPDVCEYALDGTEDFLVMACDGLWDVLNEDDTASIVYDAIYENPDLVADVIARRLVLTSKEKGSLDNISVIVVFLKDPAKIAAEPRREIRLANERMEAGFDSTNASSNPFASSNGADILATHQKDAFLLDLDGFRPNHPPTNDGFFVASNGKEDFDEDLDDLGPETDVDAVDEVQSPVKLIPGMSEELEEKVAKEIDANLLKSVVENCTDSNLEHDEDDDHEEELNAIERKEETPTPPADEVHDAGLDSDSEDDEWNYINTAREQDKENLPPGEYVELSPVEPHVESAATVDESEEIDNMSQLNPNAEEFVPVSPTRMENRPDWSGLKEDQILAQSPRRPNQNCDFNVPEENDFVEAVKNRPSDVYSNGHENGHNKSSQEILENLLNGKNIDELEFQPTGSPSKVTVGAAEQFIFGPNSTAFSTPNKFMDQSRSSTKANYGDDTNLDESDLLDRLNKEKDPMSMSFYQDKEDDETPFDMNKEGKDLDEKEQEEPLPNAFVDSGLDNAETTDLDHKDDEDFGVCELPKSPLAVEATPEIEHRNPTPDVSEEIEHAQPQFEDISQPEESFDRKFDTDDEIIERPQEPLMEVGAKSPLPNIISEEHEVEDFAPSIEIHMDAVLDEPVGHPEPVVCYASREAELFHQEAASEEISEASDIQQQEFIPETTLEVAQSPEPVVLDYTPELSPVIPMGVHKFAEEQIPMCEPEVCLSPQPVKEIIEPVTIPEVVETEFSHEHVESVFTPEPVVSQLEAISPIVELNPVVEQEQLLDIEKHVGDLMESETPKIVEPLLKMTTEICSGGDFDAREVETPVDESTSSVKNDSPMEEIKEIKDEIMLAEAISPQQVLIPESPKILGSPIEILESPDRVFEEINQIIDITNTPALTEIKPFESPAEEVPEKDTMYELPRETLIPEVVAPVEPAIIEELTAIAAPVAQTVATVGSGVVAEADTKKSGTKSKTTTAAPLKKATSKTTASKPLASTKPLASKPAAPRSALASKSAASKTTTAKPAPSTTSAAKSPAKPRVPLTGAPKSAADKKPLTNGDAKAAPAPKVPPIRRPQVPSTTKSTVPKPTGAIAKPPAAASTNAKPATKTASTTLKLASKPLTTTTAAPPKPRPATLSARTTTTTKTATSSRPLSSSTTSATRTVTSKTTSSTTAASKPKPASAPLSKPRVPLSVRTTTTTRAPDAEKQNKENVNKLTASRTAATRTMTTRKPDSTKTTSAPKTTSTTAKVPPIKRPLAKATNGPAALNKPKEEKETIVPNGVSDEKAKESAISEPDQLQKDLSPVNDLIIDNSQLAEATAD